MFGRKNLLMLSVIGFTAASFLCGLAPNAAARSILFRILQGATGGALQPLSQAVLLEAFPPHDRGKAMGFWAPRHRRRADSRSGARRLAHRQLQLALGLLHQHPGRHRVDRDDEDVHLRSGATPTASRSRIDYWGIGMLTVGIGALQIVLDKGQEDDWFSSQRHPRADDRRGGHARRADRPSN